VENYESKCVVEVEVEIATDGQAASVSWCRVPIWNLWSNFSFLSDSCGFLDVQHPLWREDRSVICLYNCFWALPEQSLSGSSPAELTTIFCCLIWDSLNVEVQLPIFMTPEDRVAQLYLRALGSLFVATYDSQRYGECILTRLQTGTQNYVLFADEIYSPSRCLASIGGSQELWENRCR
jgi:hypothetical protein